MAFFEQQLSPRITNGARGGPQWSTTVARSAGGRRSTNRNWAYPLHRYDVSQGLRTVADFEELRAFFYLVAGQADGFRFKDWTDYRCTQANSRCTLISGSQYQLQRVYALGGREFLRRIQKPVAGTVTVYRTRSGATSAAVATVDATTGIATISGHLAGDTYTWAGEFDVPVAFTADVADIEAIRGQGQLYASWAGISVEEIRL